MAPADRGCGREGGSGRRSGRAPPFLTSPHPPVRDLNLSLWRQPELVKFDRSIFMNQGEWELLYVLSHCQEFSVKSSDSYAEMKFYVRLLGRGVCRGWGTGEGPGPGSSCLVNQLFCAVVPLPAGRRLLLLSPSSGSPQGTPPSSPSGWRAALAQAIISTPRGAFPVPLSCRWSSAGGPSSTPLACCSPASS